MRLVEILTGAEPVAVVGEPGVGKTTVVRAALAECPRRAFEGGALATLSWLPYLPLGRALGRRDFGAGDPAYVAREVEAAVGDGVLFLDDLHAADSATRALLPLLTGRVALVVGVRRGDAAAPDVLEELRRLQFAVLELDPLAESDAAELVHALRPQLDAASTARIVARAGGNPLLLEELARTGEPTESLRLALAARLRPLDHAVRETAALLALAGRPLPRDMLEAPDALLRAGIAVQSAGEIGIRHGLIAEVLVEQLDGPERRRLHARLARLLPDPGESGRHHAEAGEDAEAYAKAMEAAARAETPGEQAAHLALAASCSSGVEADRLRLRAAAALQDGRDYAGVEQLLDALESSDALVRAEAGHLRFRSRWVHRDFSGARAALEEGLADVRGSGSPVEVRLLLEEASVLRQFDPDPAQTIPRARRALRMARRAGVFEAFAEYELATSLAHIGSPGAIRRLRAALEAALRDGDRDTEHRAANNLLVYLLGDGRVNEAREAAVTAANRMATLRLLGLERRFEAWELIVDWYAGRPDRVLARAARMNADRLEPSTRRLVHTVHGQALTAAAHFDEANDVLRAARTVAGDSAHVPAGSAQEWLATAGAAAELAWWSGRPLDAVRLVDEALDAVVEREPLGATPFLLVTRRWALADLGVVPEAAQLGPVRRLARGAIVELAGLDALSRGEPVAAADAFGRARTLWRGRHRPSELRCAWAKGDALRLAGAATRARTQLEAVERDAVASGFAALAIRIAQSLRLLGVHRSAARSLGNGGLTGRERQMLELVGSGLTNIEIARRLGVTGRTVETTIAAASRKLGANSRSQAAVLAART